MIELLQSGKAIFGVSVGSLWRQIKDALGHEEYVDGQWQMFGVIADQQRPCAGFRPPYVGRNVEMTTRRGSGWMMCGFIPHGIC